MKKRRMCDVLLSALIAGVLYTACGVPSEAQWQTPAGTIPVGKGPGATGFNTVSGSGGTGTLCLIDTVPPTFGSCGAAGSIVVGTTAITGGTNFNYLYNNAGILGEVPAPITYVTQAPYNAVCNGSANDTVAIQAAITAIGVRGGTIAIPAGRHCRVTTLDFKGKTNVVFTGLGSGQSGGGSTPGLLYCDTTGANICLDARDTSALTISNMTILSVNALYTGFVIDAGSQTPGSAVSAFFKLKDTTIGATYVAGVKCVDVSEATHFVLEENNFTRCAPAIKGQDITGQSTTGTIAKNRFGTQVGPAISECGESWRIENNAFQQDVAGSANGMAVTPARPCVGLVFSGNWSGDVTSGAGTWLSITANGAEITGNRFGGGASAVGIALTGGNGYKISGNSFDTFTVGISCTSSPTGGAIEDNYFVTVTTRISGTCVNFNSREGNSPSSSAYTAGQIGIGQAAADVTPRTVTGNVTISSAGVTSLDNIPSDVIVDGYMLWNDAATASAPAAGFGWTWFDSTDQRLHDRNNAGTIGTTVVADTGAANNYISAISAAGVITKSQPNITGIAGLGANVATFLGTPSGANFAAALTSVTRTRQVFTSGSGTYTTPANVKYIVVRMVGAGGGGGGGGTGAPTDGGAGGNTTFSTFTAGGGAGGKAMGLGAGATAGGTATGGTINIPGQGTGSQTTLTYPDGTGGGGSAFFGGGGYGSTSGVNASPGATNSGGGGGGGGSSAGARTNGTGGGGGGSVEGMIVPAAASYSYAVGAGGTAGSPGTNGVTGQAGAAGIIIVDEFYQ